MAINTTAVARTLEAGFMKGISEAWKPTLARLSRTIDMKGRDTKRIYSLGDLGLPERNPVAITFETPGSWHVDIEEPDSWAKGFSFTDEDKAHLSELVMKARGLPSLFERAYDNHRATMLVEGDGTTYGTVPDGITAAGISMFSGTGVGHVYPGDVSCKTAMFNLLQAAEVSALNIGTPAEPTDAEFRLAVAACKQYIAANIKDTAGENLFASGAPVSLLLPENLEMNARSAFETALISTGGTNIYRGYVKEIIPDARLTDTAIFYLLVEQPGTMERPIWQADFTVDGVKRFGFAWTDQNSDSYVKNDPGQHYFRASSKQTLRYGDWRMLFRCVFS